MLLREKFLVLKTENLQNKHIILLFNSFNVYLLGDFDHNVKIGSKAYNGLYDDLKRILVNFEVNRRVIFIYKEIFINNLWHKTATFPLIRKKLLKREY